MSKIYPVCVIGVLATLWLPDGLPKTVYGEPASQIVMKQAIEEGAGIPQIDGGDKLNETDWPATLKYSLDSKLSCTATIVGDRAVLLAAHCLDQQKQMTVELKDKSKFFLKCTANPQFDPLLLYADVALCLSTDEKGNAKSFPHSFAFENLDLKITRVRRDEALFLAGFGCRDVLNPGGSQRGILYGGLTKVQLLSTAGDGHFYAQGGVVICNGDSGGAAYILSDPKAPLGPRSIVGVNSGFHAETRRSLLSGLTGANAIFVRDWRDDNRILICGLDPEATNCRDKYIP